MDLITTIIITSLIIPLLAFAYSYDKGSALFKPRKYKFGQGVWRKSSEGRTIMAQKLSLTALVALIAVMRIFGEFDGSEILRLLTYTSVGVVFWGMFVILQNVYKEDEE